MIPTVNRAAPVGIVTLPGSMSGMIFAGISPIEPVRYQMLMEYVVIGSVTYTLFCSALLACRQFFTKHQQVRSELLKENGGVINRIRKGILRNTETECRKADSRSCFRITEMASALKMAAEGRFRAGESEHLQPDSVEIAVGREQSDKALACFAGILPKKAAGIRLGKVVDIRLKKAAGILLDKVVDIQMNKTADILPSMAADNHGSLHVLGIDYHCVRSFYPLSILGDFLNHSLCVFDQIVMRAE